MMRLAIFNEKINTIKISDKEQLANRAGRK